MRFSNRRQPFRLLDGIGAQLSDFLNAPTGFAVLPAGSLAPLDPADRLDRLRLDILLAASDIADGRLGFIQAAVRAGTGYDPPARALDAAAAWLDRVGRFVQARRFLGEEDSAGDPDAPDPDDLIRELGPIRRRLWEVARVTEGILFPADQEPPGKIASDAVTAAEWPRWREERVRALTVWYHGGQSYSRNGVTQRHLSTELHCVLQAFLKLPTAHDGGRLAELSGVANIPRAMNHLATCCDGLFADAIIRPAGAKGNGGYLVYVSAVHKSG